MRYVATVVWLMLIFILSCDDAGVTDMKNNSVEFRGNTIQLEYASIKELAAEPKSWEIEMKTITSDFVSRFQIVSLKGNITDGSYSLGDLNNDGVTNEYDAMDAGYIINAIVEDKTTSEEYSSNLISGYLKLTKVDNQYTIEIDCRDESGERLRGVSIGQLSN